MCTTECNVDTLENWTSSGGIDWQLVSETQKGQTDKAAGDQLGKELEEWVQSQSNESQLIDSVSVKPTNEHQEESAAIDKTRKTDQKSMTPVMHSWVLDDQQPRKEDSSGFSMEVEHKVERRIVSRFPQITKLLLANRSLSRKERWKHEDNNHGSIIGKMAARVEEEVDIHSSIRERRFSSTGARVDNERDVDT